MDYDITPNMPLVTIGVASYNNAQYILETLDSVAWQRYPHIELIIVDDCSTDNSVLIIEDWLAYYNRKATFIRHEINSGICRAANEILATAQGKYFMIVGSDDILLQDKIISQVIQLEELGEEYALSYSDVQMINAAGENIEEEFHKKNFKRVQGDAFALILKQNFVQAPSTLYRTEVVRTLGGYDETLSFEDLDILLRLSRKYKIAYNEYTNAKYRRIATSLSSKFSVKHLNSLLYLLEKQYGVSPETDRIIDDYVRSNAEIVYREGGSQAAYWLKRNWQLVGGAKAGVLYLLSLASIPYKFITFMNAFTKLRHKF